MDLHSPFTTVEEAVRFSAALRTSADVPDSQRDAFVEVIRTGDA
jgi:hypothetical protein